MTGVVNGVHVIINSTDAPADRAFFRDVLGFDAVDAGDGWLIFALPPAELAVHPGQDDRNQLYLMCADLEEALHELESKGVTVKAAITEQPWGRLMSITLPGGGELSLYQPKHPLAHSGAVATRGS